MKNLTPQWWLGIIVGLVVPLIGVIIMIELHPELIGIQQYERDLVKQINVKIVTFGMILNAAIFFLLLRLEKEEMSKGVLFASVIYLIITFIYRFLYV